MNRRILKKHCKRAVEILIAKHGFRPSQFLPAQGDEAADAPPNMERRSVYREWLTPGPLKGTPLYWRQTSSEYDEWDFELPTQTLDHLNWCASIDWSKQLAAA